MSRLPLLVLGVACLGLRPAAAATVPPPTAPFVAAPVPGTQWSISLNYPKREGEGAAPAGRLAGITGHYGENVTLVRQQRAEGKAQEGFVAGNKVLAVNSATGRVMILPSDEGNWGSPFFIRGFPGMQWLSQATYRRVEEKNGVDCYTFHQEARSFSDPSEGISHPDLTAWVRVKDKAPVAFRIGEIDYLYAPLTRGSVRVTLPDAVRRMAERLAAQQRALEAMRRR